VYHQYLFSDVDLLPEEIPRRRRRTANNGISVPTRVMARTVGRLLHAARSEPEGCGETAAGRLCLVRATRRGVGNHSELVLSRLGNWAKQMLQLALLYTNNSNDLKLHRPHIETVDYASYKAPIKITLLLKQHFCGCQIDTAPLSTAR